MISLKKKSGNALMDHLGFAVIGAFILVGVLVFLLLRFGPEVKGFFDNLPGFGNKTAEVKGFENLRYNFLSEGVEYYNGDKWFDFEKDRKVSLNKKIVMYADAKKSFLKVFDYNSFANKRIEIGDKKISYAIVSDGKEVSIAGISTDGGWLKDIPSSYNKPANVFVGVFASDTSTSTPIGIYILDMRNNFNFIPIKRNAFGLGSYEKEYVSSSDRVSLKSQVITLRDEALKKSIDIGFSTETSGKTSESKVITVCVTRKYGQEYLVVDLSSPVSSAEECV